MREILFKAKSLDTGEWVEGYYWVTPANRQYITTAHGIFNEIDPETVCQYTGLVDKAGNKIWENDIVNCFKDELIVVFRHGAFYHKHKTQEAYGHLGETNYPFEESNVAKHYQVIGNKWDNPELFEKP